MFKKVFVSLLALLVFFALPSLALYLKTGDSISIPKDVLINDNLLVVGKTIEVFATVTGDLIAVGESILVDGNVKGNVIAGGRNVFIKSAVKNDLIAGGWKLDVMENARVGKDAFLVCINGTIDGKILRDLKVGANTLGIGANALVAGKFDHSVENLDISDLAKIVGKTTFHERTDLANRVTKYAGFFVYFKKILGALSVLLLGAISILFMPKQVNLITEKMSHHFWTCMGWGILFLAVIPLIGGFLLLTMVGIPLAVLMMFAYAFVIYINGIFSSIVIGKMLFHRIGMPAIPQILALLLGFFVLELVGVIPVLGGLMRLVLVFWAFGAIVSSQFSVIKAARAK